MRWDSSQLRSLFCDVANARSSGAQVVLSFGVRRTRSAADLQVELLHRVALTPHAARGLQQLLNRLVAEHESLDRQER